MAVANRKDERSALAAMLETSLVGAGLPLQKVYDHFPKDYVESDGTRYDFTLAMVSDSSSPREEDDQISPDVVFRVVLVVSVLYEGDNWTVEDSQDRLDDIDAIITDTLRANSEHLAKEYYRDQSDVDVTPEEGGISRWVEVIPVRVQIYNCT